MSASRLLYPGGTSPPLDGKTPVFEEVGADPSAGAGMDRPPGSIAKHGADYYLKFDTGATDWAATPFSSGGGGGDAADWPIASPRFYALDADAGSDANAGFSDVSAAAAIAVAVATPARLAALIPAAGNGRSLVVLVVPRAAGADYATGLALRGKVGYGNKVLRASHDGANTAAERTICGAVDSTATAAWTVTAGVDAYTFSVTEALPAADSLRGHRIRILTGALAGQVSRIRTQGAGAGATIVLGAPLTGTPAAGATFAIERPGASFPTIDLDGPTDLEGIRTVILGWNVAGLRCTGAGTTAWTLIGGHFVVSFCEAVRQYVNLCPRLYIDTFYVAEDGSTCSTGAGVRATGQCSYQEIGSIVMKASDFSGAGSFFICIGRFTVGSKGCTFATMPVVENCGYGRWFDEASQENSFGHFAADGTKPTLVGGAGAGFGFNGCNLRVTNVDIAAIGALGLVFTGDGCSLVVEGVVGATGGAGPGLDFSALRQSTVTLGVAAANTTAGSGGVEVKLAGPCNAAHVDFTKTNIPDVNGNNVQGTAGTLVSGAALFSGGNHAGVALEPGQSVYQDGTGAALSDADALASTRSDGITLNTAAATDGSPVYIAPPGSFPYVFPETVVTGGLAYVSVTAGRIQGNPPAAADFKLRLGYFLTGVDNTSGRLSYHPELLAAPADGEE